METRIPARFAPKLGFLHECGALICRAAQVTKLFQERLQAWKHACGYLEEYLTATEKLQLSQAKEYEKVLKVREPRKTPRRMRRIAHVSCTSRP